MAYCRFGAEAKRSAIEPALFMSPLGARASRPQHDLLVNNAGEITSGYRKIIKARVIVSEKHERTTYNDRAASIRQPNGFKKEQMWAGSSAATAPDGSGARAEFSTISKTACHGSTGCLRSSMEETMGEVS